MYTLFNRNNNIDMRNVFQGLINLRIKCIYNYSVCMYVLYEDE